MSEDRHFIEEVFKSFVETSAEEDLSAWLRRGLAMGDFTPIPLSQEPIEEAQIQDLCETLSYDLREKFKAATCLALSAWSPRADGLILLRRLVVVAAYVRESEVVDHIRKIIVDGWLESFGEERKFETLQILIAVSGGFAPLGKVQVLFERLFMSPRLDHRFAAQLFLGLCVCDAERYVEYVPRLLQVIRDAREYFRLDYLLAEMVRVVGLPTIARRFQDIDSRYREDFRRLLCEYEWSPATIRVHPERGVCIAPHPDFEALGPEYRFDSSMYPLFSHDRFDLAARDEETDALVVRLSADPQSGAWVPYLRRRLEAVRVAI